MASGAEEKQRSPSPPYRSPGRVCLSTERKDDRRGLSSHLPDQRGLSIFCSRSFSPTVLQETIAKRRRRLAEKAREGNGNPLQNEQVWVRCMGAAYGKAGTFEIYNLINAVLSASELFWRQGPIIRLMDTLIYCMVYQRPSWTSCGNGDRDHKRRGN